MGLVYKALTIIWPPKEYKMFKGGTIELINEPRNSLEIMETLY
jgi:hypothetical protein